MSTVTNFPGVHQPSALHNRLIMPTKEFHHEQNDLTLVADQNEPIPYDLVYVILTVGSILAMRPICFHESEL